METYSDETIRLLAEFAQADTEAKRAAARRKDLADSVRALGLGVHLGVVVHDKHQRRFSKAAMVERYGFDSYDLCRVPAVFTQVEVSDPTAALAELARRALVEVE